VTTPVASPVAALDRLLELTVLLDQDMTRALGASGLTQARTHALWLIDALGPCTQRTLADALRVTPRNVTGLVDGLVDTGFALRAPHPTDRRALQLSLTPLGAATIARLKAGREELAGQLFGAVPDPRLGVLVGELEGLVERLRGLLDHSV
jgi:DNA-binding MarR family transcriptional regulator